MKIQTIDIHDVFVRHIFHKSKRKRGFIYLCEYVRKESSLDSTTGEITPLKGYKYGKTVNLENRMNLYGEKYKLLKSWKADHLKLREWLIHNNDQIKEGRYWNEQHDNDEHVIEFDCQELVEFYATATIKLKKLNWREFTIKLIPSSKFMDSWGIWEIDIRNLLYAI